MQLWTDLIDPATQSEFARTIVEQYDGQDVLAQILPSTQVDDVVFSWNVNQVLDEMAQFRAFDAETPIGRGIKGERKTAELAPLGLKLRFGEYDQLRRRGANSPESVQAAFDRLTVTVAKAAVDRLSRLRAEALVNGTLAIDENEFVQNVSFGRAAGQTQAAPAALWSAAGADPVTDLLEWQEMIQDASGADPGVIIMSGRVYQAMAATIAGSDYVTTQTGTVSREVVNDILVSYGLPPVTVNNRKVGGVRLVPDTAVIMAVTGGLAGGTPWGTPVDADEPGYGFANYGLGAPGIVVGAYKTEDPNTKWIRSDAISLPVLSVPDATLSAKVL